jgi:hypothetical protein
MKHTPDDEANRAMALLDAIERTEPQPFFYTRLMARMEREAAEAGPAVVGWVPSPVQLALGLAVVVLLNLWVVLAPRTGNVPAEEGANTYQLYDPNAH